VVIAAPVFLDGPTPGTKQQPESQVRIPGETVTLSAGVRVTGDTRFQWYFRPTGTSEWLQMPGATTSTTKIFGVTNADDGDYRLEVSNSAATISSDSARVTVLKPVVPKAVTVSPVAVNPGGDVTLTAAWTGELIESKPFQWFVQDSRTRAWKVLEGQNEPRLPSSPLPKPTMPTTRCASPARSAALSKAHPRGSWSMIRWPLPRDSSSRACRWSWVNGPPLPRPPPGSSLSSSGTTAATSRSRGANCPALPRNRPPLRPGPSPPRWAATTG
jgi:hypothetical protein